MLSTIFILNTLLFCLIFYFGTGRDKRVLYVSILWIFSISTLALYKFFLKTDSTPPRYLVVFLGNVVFVLYVYNILKNKEISNNYIMAIHVFRIPIEVFLFFLYLEKQVPKSMTFIGLNFDILIGVSALIILIATNIFTFQLTKNILLIWNWIGLLFLMNIVVIAVLSAPLPFQQMSFDRPNIAVLSFPYVLLPSYIVPVVFLAHIIAIKHLGIKWSATAHLVDGSATA